MERPNKNGIWWYQGHRRLIPSVPYDYKVPPLYYLKGNPKPEEPKIFFNPGPVSKQNLQREMNKPAPLNSLFEND